MIVHDSGVTEGGPQQDGRGRQAVPGSLLRQLRHYWLQIQGMATALDERPNWSL